MIHGKKLTFKEEYFTISFSSAQLLISKGNIRNVEPQITEHTPSNILCKLVSVPLKDHGDMLFVPLVHTLDNEE